MNAKVLSGFVVLVLATAACTANTSEAGSNSSAASADPGDFCSRICARQASCDSSVDEDTCATKCDDATGNTISRMRSDVVDSIAACVEDSDCKTVLQDGVDSCVSEAAASVSATADTKDTCRAVADAVDHCGVSDFDTAGCFNQLKVYSDPVLKAVKKCASKDCGALGDCVDAALGTE